MTDLNKIVQTLEQLLRQEQGSRIASRADIRASQLRRKEIETLLSGLYEPYQLLSGQISNLPDLPDERHMNWAEAVLSMRNLTILVLDTTGLDENSDDIIRIYAMPASGLWLDQLIKPVRVQSANTPYTGIAWKELNDAPTLTEAWEDIIKPFLSGQFVVSYGLPFIKKMLRGNIDHYGLSRLLFHGEDLMSQAKKYFGVQEYGYGSGLKLTDACLRIGHKIPSPTFAADRAQGCLELLKAMANGVTSDTDLGELGNNPF